MGFSNGSNGLARKFLAVFLGMGTLLIALELVLPLFPSLLQVPKRASDGSTRILCLGNSHTAGIGAGAGLGYCEQVEKQLREDARFGALDVRVVNLGVAGRNSTEVMRALPAQLQEYQPKLVLLMTGEPNAWNEEGYQAFLARESRAPAAPVAWLRDRIQRLHTYRLAKLVFSGAGPGERLFPEIPVTETKTLGFAWFGLLYPGSARGKFPPLSDSQWKEAIESLAALHERTIKYHLVVPLLLGRIFESLGKQSEAVHWYIESSKVLPEVPHLEFVQQFQGKLLEPGEMLKAYETSTSTLNFDKAAEAELRREQARLYSSSDFTQALLARPADFKLLDGLFSAFLAEGLPKEALAALERIARWNPFGGGASLLNQFHRLRTVARKLQRPDVIEAADNVLARLQAEFPAESDFHRSTDEKREVERWVESDVVAIARYLQSRHIPLLLQTYPPKHDGTERAENRAIRSAASSAGLALVDIELLFPKDREKYFASAALQEDHLNSDGYELLGGQIAAAIKQLGIPWN